MAKTTYLELANLFYFFNLFRSTSTTAGENSFSKPATTATTSRSRPGAGNVFLQNVYKAGKGSKWLGRSSEIGMFVYYNKYQWNMFKNVCDHCVHGSVFFGLQILHGAHVLRFGSGLQTRNSGAIESIHFPDAANPGLNLDGPPLAKRPDQHIRSTGGSSNFTWFTCGSYCARFWPS